tara:strand:+ start:2525 stop:2725 length:201 start_codon:yes stop_codon:yes gene_type:complete
MKALLKAKKEGYRDQWVTINKDNKLTTCSIYNNSEEFAAELNPTQIEELCNYRGKSKLYDVVLIVN